MILNELPRRLKQLLIFVTVGSEYETTYLTDDGFRPIHDLVFEAIKKEIPEYQKYQNIDFKMLLLWTNKRGPYKFKFEPNFKNMLSGRTINNVHSTISEIYFDPFKNEVVLIEYQNTTKKFIDTVISI